MTCSRSCSLKLHASVLPIRALLSRRGPGNVGSPFHLPGRRWLRDALTARSLESSTAHLNLRSLPVLPRGLGVQEGGAWGKRGDVSPEKLDPGDPGPLQGARLEPGPACPLGPLQRDLLNRCFSSAPSRLPEPVGRGRSRQLTARTRTDYITRGRGAGWGGLVGAQGCQC